MKAPFLFLCLLGAAWLAKGVLHLMGGHGSDSWGDDLVYGGLLAIVGVLGWLAARRHAIRREAGVG